MYVILSLGKPQKLFQDGWIFFNVWIFAPIITQKCWILQFSSQQNRQNSSFPILWILAPKASNFNFYLWPFLRIVKPCAEIIPFQCRTLARKFKPTRLYLTQNIPKWDFLKVIFMRHWIKKTSLNRDSTVLGFFRIASMIWRENSNISNPQSFFRKRVNNKKEKMLCLKKENLWLNWSLAYLRKWFWQFSQIINLNNLWLPWSHFWGERPAKNSIFTILIIFLMPHQWIFMTDAIVIHNWSLNFVVSFFFSF